MLSDIELVVFDMEGTLTADPTLWEIMHLKVGTWESHGARYWEQFRAGVFQYDEFARMDVAAWKGAAESLLTEAVNSVSLMTGCEETLIALNAAGIRSAIVSNGLHCLARRLAGELGIQDMEANREVIRNGLLTGELDICVPYTGKADALLRIATRTGISQSRILAVGDGQADVPMFRAAGAGVAFRPESPDVAAFATHVIDDGDLRALLPLLGVG